MNDWRLHAEYLAEAWYLHINSIKPMFCGSSMISHFTDGFVLRCFQHLSIERVAALHALLDNRSTRGVESSFLSYQKILPFRYQTFPVDIKPTASQRCEPSSRSLLIGEHPHPWTLLHVQDRKSRHRCSKTRRR